MIRTLIVDDQNIIREGIKVLLEQASEIEIIGIAKDGASALEQAANLRPDVILLDIDMPDIDGLTVANQLRSRFPNIKVIILSSHEEEKYVQKATTLGVKGYLLKSVSSQELEWSIKLVHQGYSAMKSELLEQQLENKSYANLVPVRASVQQLARSQQEQQNLHSLESVFTRNQLYRYNSSSNRSSRNKHKVNRKFNQPHWSQTNKTLMSWEFKILAFTILFSLGFLVSN
jgi:YesN/AraC family two-component response regulator